VQTVPPFLAMTLSALYPPPAELAKHAHIKSREQYDKLYKQSLEDPDTFWSEQAEAFHWTKRWKLPVLEYVPQGLRQAVLDQLSALCVAGRRDIQCPHSCCVYAEQQDVLHVARGAFDIFQPAIAVAVEV